MKCPCGGIMRERKGDAPLEEGGVKLTLRDVRIFTCAQCGSESPAIPRISSLFRAIADTLARKRARLAPKEIRFLRKYLGYSGRDFAKRVGVAATTVSKWESEVKSQPMGPQMERLLRVMALDNDRIASYPLEDMASEEPRPTRLKLRVGPKGWEEEPRA